ncbi:hypothetical protein, partial [Aneurinibacillus aneurinilyticus]|uniref:hypothetical protein n=1 Tax=Aneurinibacillus aneurinilyticus TaxID=1391 RepID=UPI002E201109|nr:hypothetical protein [Aneurinibacillus aneurinilyticus]
PHREAQMFCRSGLGATKRPCLFLVRKRRGNTPTRAPSFFHLMDNQQAWYINLLHSSFNTKKAFTHM